MAYETLELERDGPVLRVWLARPERLNAISLDMLKELGDLFAGLETDFETRLVVLGGRGRSFSAGMDRAPAAPTSLPTERTPRARRWLGQLGRRACRAIEDCEALTLARVQGHAFGGGCCFAAACDFRVAATDASFRLPEIELGIPLTWGAVPRLIHEVGAARARELLIRCHAIDGRRAEQYGLVHEAVAPQDLDAAVARWEQELLAKPEIAVHMTKTQLRGYARRASLGDVTESDGDLLGAAASAPGWRERMSDGFEGD